MTDNEIILFKHDEFGEIRTLNIDGEPWFVGKDVAKILQYERATKAIVDRVDEEDRIMLDKKTQSQFRTELGQRGGWIVNESGLYCLILSSKMPSARKFRHWITAEVLPSLRKHGAYFTAETLHKTMSDPRELAKLLTTLADEQDKRRKLEEENAFLSVKAKYYDRILNSKNAVPVTQIGSMSRTFGPSPRKPLTRLPKRLSAVTGATATSARSGSPRRGMTTMPCRNELRSL